MFGIGTGELLIFAVVLLLVVGPKRLPEFIKTVGKGLREVRQATTELRRQSGIDELMREDPIGLRALKNEINQPFAARPKPEIEPALHSLSTEQSTEASTEGLSAQDKAKEMPAEGVDIAHAKLGETVSVTSSVPVSGDASAPLAPSVAAEKSPVQESEPTMLGVPLADPYALPTALTRASTTASSTRKPAPVSVPPPPPARNKTISGQAPPPPPSTTPSSMRPRQRKISVPPATPLSARSIKQGALAAPIAAPEMRPPPPSVAPPAPSAPPPPVSPPSSSPSSSSAPRVSLPPSIPPPSGESS